MTFLPYLFAFAFGSVIGSFLNVVVYRLPRGGSLLWPPSHCTFCCEPIAWFDNVPILSYLLLAGRCRRCKSRISPRYALVEAFTGAMFCYLLFRLSTGPSGLPHAKFFAFSMLSCALLACTIIDIQRQIIPDEISLPGILIGPLVVLIFPSIIDTQQGLVPLVNERLGDLLDGRLLSLAASIVGAAGGAAVVYAAGVIGKTLFRKEAMGEGDIKFMAMVGGFIGFESVIMAFVLACVVGSVLGLLILIRWRHSRIPFGPYLSIGSFIVMLHRPQILAVLSGYADWAQNLMR